MWITYLSNINRPTVRLMLDFKTWIEALDWIWEDNNPEHMYTFPIFVEF
jgi:hypothetical protein